jgi:hypothetical protein
MVCAARGRHEVTQGARLLSLSRDAELDDRDGLSPAFGACVRVRSRSVSAGFFRESGARATHGSQVVLHIEERTIVINSLAMQARWRPCCSEFVPRSSNRRSWRRAKQPLLCGTDRPLRSAATRCAIAPTRRSTSAHLSLVAYRSRPSCACPGLDCDRRGRVTSRSSAMSTSGRRGSLSRFAPTN